MNRRLLRRKDRRRIFEPTGCTAFSGFRLNPGLKPRATNISPRRGLVWL